MLKRRVWTALFILLFVIGFSVSFAAEKRTAKVKELYGKVEVQAATSEKKIPAFKNMVIREGDKIITGKDSKIVMTVDKDKEITLAANTIAILSELKGVSTTNDTVITIQAGGVGSKIEKKLDKDSSYKIKTPTAVMGVRGTHFYVQVEKAEQKLRHPEVNIWLSKGVIEVEYRKEGANISKYTENKGELESFLMTAPKKYDFPSEGRLAPGPEKFELKGLYKEFIDYEDLSDLYDKDEIEKAKKEAEQEEDDDDDEVEEEHENPYYEDIHDDADDDDDDDDDETSSIPPKPAGNYVYIKNYSIMGGHPPATVTGTLNRWVPFTVPAGSGIGMVDMGDATGDPRLTGVYHQFFISTAEANGFVIGNIP